MQRLTAIGSLALTLAFFVVLLLPERQEERDAPRPQRASAEEILRREDERRDRLAPTARAAYDACRCRCGDGLCPEDDPNDPELLRKLKARAQSCGHRVCTMPEEGR